MEKKSTDSTDSPKYANTMIKPMPSSVSDQ
jgi:hypothetical protein